MSAGDPSGCAICVASWVELWCGLKPTLFALFCGQGSEADQCQILCNQPWDTYLEPPCYHCDSVYRAWLCGGGAKLCTRICSCSPELEADQ